MTYAHDRTLLSNLGFSDPDKKDPLHDLGCQYFIQQRVCDAMGLVNDDGEIMRLDTECVSGFERPVSKGSGKYKTTIGFIDVVLPMSHQIIVAEGTTRTVYSESIGKYKEITAGIHWSSKVDVFVEVKIALVGLGDVLRQINLYREYIHGYRWVLAAAFPMSTAMVDGLRSHNIFPVQLGDGFRKWAAEQHAAPKATDVVSL